MTLKMSVYALHKFTIRSARSDLDRDLFVGNYKQMMSITNLTEFTNLDIAWDSALGSETSVSG